MHIGKKRVINFFWVSILLGSPASGDPLILNPYPAWSLEAVSGHLLKMPVLTRKTTEKKCLKSLQGNGWGASTKEWGFQGFSEVARN